MEILFIALIFAVVAFLYSSAGFGGGSSYLAILALFGTAFIETRFIALACNIVVVAGSSVLFYRKGMIDWARIWPFIVMSIPMAYIGGTLPIEEETFFLALGGTLIVAGPAMLIRGRNYTGFAVRTGFVPNLLIGGAIGLLSGMVGIGGGIFLAPVLHLINWDSPGRIAATASLFILVNSVSGIFGQISNAVFSVNLALLAACLGAVILGGQVGVRISIRNLSPVHLRWITACLVFFVGIRVLVKGLT